MPRRTYSRKRKQEPTLFERGIYFFIGLVSGGLLTIFTLVPAMFYLFRWIPAEVVEQVYWLIPAAPIAFALTMGVWGFIQTDEMVETLGHWWQGVMDRVSSR